VSVSLRLRVLVKHTRGWQALQLGAGFGVWGLGFRVQEHVREYTGVMQGGSDGVLGGRG